MRLNEAESPNELMGRLLMADDLTSRLRHDLDDGRLVPTTPIIRQSHIIISSLSHLLKTFSHVLTVPMAPKI